MILIIVVIVLIVLLVLFVMSSYNKLVRLSNRVDEGFSTMDVYLKKRFDSKLSGNREGICET